MTKKAIVLNSGGLDSATCLAIAGDEGFDITALTFDYGQRHNAEVEAAKRLTKAAGVHDHRIVNIPVGQFCGSALTDDAVDVPDFEANDVIPVTYVPARNTIFLSIALGLAEAAEAYDIFTGVNAIDYSGYPDCRPEYFDAFQQLANLATKTGVEGKPILFRTPLIKWDKAEIIQKGASLGVDYSMTVSCYSADVEGRACGRCDACAFRAKGFKDAGVQDPTRYVSEKA